MKNTTHHPTQKQFLGIKKNLLTNLFLFKGQIHYFWKPDLKYSEKFSLHALKSLANNQR